MIVIHIYVQVLYSLEKCDHVSALSVGKCYYSMPYIEYGGKTFSQAGCLLDPHLNNNPIIRKFNVSQSKIIILFYA